jgi:crossover junction endodeoxyribonuclease RusA
MLAQVAMFELPVLEFVVLGTPITQGSKAVAGYAGKRVPTKHGLAIVKPRAILVEQSNMATKTRKSHRLKRWREAIALTAMRTARDLGWQCGDWPVNLCCEFVFARPDSHFTAGDRARGRLTSSAPTHHVGYPDQDKLLRAVGDALTGVAYADDSQVVSHDGSLKRWSHSAVGKPGVRVTVRRLA